MAIDSNHTQKSIVHASWPSIYLLLLVCLCGTLVYSRTLDVPFYFDDYSYIVNNPIITTLSGVFDKDLISTALVETEDVRKSVLTRPLPYFTFAIDYALHRLSVAGLHVGNISIHIINSLLIYLLIVQMYLHQACRRNEGCQSQETGNTARPIAFFTALLFVVHPVMTGSVTCIFQRTVLLTTFFYLLTVLLYVRWRLHAKGRTASGILYALALLSCFAAMKCKEIAFTLPLMLVLYDCIACCGTLRQRCVRLVPFLLLLAVIPMTLISLDKGEIAHDSNEMPSTLHAASYIVKSPLTYLSTQFTTNSNQTAITSMSPLEYLFTQLRVVASYQRLMLVPTGLNFLHDFPFYRSLADPVVLLALLFHTFVLSFAIHLLRTADRVNSEEGLLRRSAGFGLLWFYLALAVECSIIPVDDHYHEYRLYLPAFGYLVAFVCTVRMAATRWRGSRMASFGFNGLLIAMVLVFSVLTLVRNEQWRDPLEFWQDALAKSPKKVRIHGYIGNVYRDRGDIPSALKEYRLMLANDFRYWQDHFELGDMLLENGTCREAVEEYLVALRIDPGRKFIYGQLAKAYRCLGEINNAVRAEKMSMAETVDGSASGKVGAE